MKLADMLAYADIHQLSRIARHYECECGSHSKHELIQSILSAVGRRDTLEQSLQSLTLEEQRFLNALLFDKRDAFSLEELLAWARRTRFQEQERIGDPVVPIVLEPLTEPVEQPPKKGRKAARKKAPAEPSADPQVWNPRETIMKFKQRGWLFNGHSHHTKYLFTVPSDLKQRIGDGLKRQLARTVDICEPPDAYRDEHDLLLGDIVRFLQFVRHEDVWLTADGFMYKRQLQQLLKTLQVEEAPVQKGAWRFGYGRKFKEYPNRFSLIYDFCYYQQYIAEEEQRLLLTDGGAALLNGELKTGPVDIYRFWIRLYKGPIPNIQPLVHWVNRLAEQWVTVQSLGRTLCPFIRPYYYDEPESIFEERILKMMMHLGLLRIGRHSDDGQVVQMTSLGSRVVNGTYVDEQDRIDL